MVTEYVMLDEPESIVDQCGKVLYYHFQSQLVDGIKQSECDREYFSDLYGALNECECA